LTYRQIELEKGTEERERRELDKQTDREGKQKRERARTCRMIGRKAESLRNYGYIFKNALR
jgi:hypothetical protein